MEINLWSPRPPLCFSEKNVLITSGAYECSYNQRNYLVFWKSVPRVHVLITRFLYDVLITRVLITRVDCIDEGTIDRGSLYMTFKIIVS